MAVTVYIPTPFRRATANRDRVEVAAPDVRSLLDALEQAHGGLKGLLRDERGEVHHHINIYVNSEGLESLQGLATKLRDGDEVAIIPALAGGRSAKPPDVGGAAGTPGRGEPVEGSAKPQDVGGAAGTPGRGEPVNESRGCS